MTTKRTTIKEETKSRKVLAFTPTYGHRLGFEETVRGMRAHAGMWFDWAVYAGRPTDAYNEQLDKLLHDPNHAGIQFYQRWPENRGQHYAFQAALELAKSQGYEWLVRIDDDVTPKTKRWLAGMLQRLYDLKAAAKDDQYRLVAVPKVMGLRYPLQPVGNITKDVGPVEVMSMVGGAVRVHNVQFFERFIPLQWGPLGRGDPDAIADYVENMQGLMVRFPDIRVVHRTAVLEAAEAPDQGHERRMGWYWPYMGPGSEVSFQPPIEEDLDE